jgi:autotransporter-associated beta strand protein
MTDGVWLLAASNGNYFDSANWFNGKLPDGTGTAFFDTSFKTNLSLSSASTTLTTVGGWTFNTGTNYSFTVSDFDNLIFLGTGIFNSGAAVGITVHGILQFAGGSTAGNASINNNGKILFSGKAGQATITNSGSLWFVSTSSADSAVITTTSGAKTTFANASDGDQAQLITQFGGTVDFSPLGATGVGFIRAGSIAGAGTYKIGTRFLIVGGNNLSTEVSGTIEGTNFIQKTGTGSLRLSHNNGATFTGGTELIGGTLDLAAPHAAGSQIKFAFPNDTLLIENTALAGHGFETPVTDFAGGEVIDLSGLAFAVGTQASYNPTLKVLSVTSGGTTVTVPLSLNATGVFVSYFDGHGGTAVAYDHRINGTAHNDVLAATFSPDYFNGRAGIDLVSYANAPGGVNANIANPTFNAGWAAGDHYKSIEGLIGSPFDDVLTGNAGANILRGGVGNDRLTGGAGNDRLIGGPGNDLLIGGAGNDAFVFQPGFGNDAITGFTPGTLANHDTVELHSTPGLNNFAQVKAHATVINGHVVISDTTGDTITLNSVHKVGQLHGYDFHFLA